MKSAQVSVIIPAAGFGVRFKSRGENKLYSPIAGKPLIAYVLNAFDTAPSVREMILAVRPGTQVEFRKEILSQFKIKKPVHLVSGGKTRAESVWNALRQVSKSSDYVCIHDGARPLVQTDWVEQLIHNLNGWDGVVWGRRSIPTVKAFDPGTGEIKRTLDRTQLFEAETPQLFKKSVLIKAYQTLEARAFQATDDASLVEAAGGRVKAVTHSNSNIKVTTPQDLNVVRALIGKSQNLKFGLGFDRHRLKPKRTFYLGGLRIPSQAGPIGHSDGDPLLHAVTDAILGAVGAGDIGDFFPDTSKRWKNVRSVKFLKEAIKQARKKGFQPAQVDATIILERPILGPWKKKIGMHLAKLLSITKDNVSIKAKTAEGFGPEGEGLAVSCQALVVLNSNG